MSLVPMLAMVFGHLFIQLVIVVPMIIFPLNAVCMLVEAKHAFVFSTVSLTCIMRCDEAWVVSYSYLLL